MHGLLPKIRGGEPVGLSPNIRVYRYTKGQYFDCHCMFLPISHMTPSKAVTGCSTRPQLYTLFLAHAYKSFDTDAAFFSSDADDESNVLSLPGPVPVRTTWTLLLYLTSAAEGCVGGETVFYPHDRQVASEEIAVPLETGMLLLHKHGDECLLVSCSADVSSLLRFAREYHFGNRKTNQVLARRKRGERRGEMGAKNRSVHQKVKSSLFSCSISKFSFERRANYGSP